MPFAGAQIDYCVAFSQFDIIHGNRITETVHRISRRY
jgi:hypothetical protein